MRSQPDNKAAYIVSIILITLFFGCTVEQTHKTLTFFFDGVDKVIYFNDYLSHDSLGRIAAAKREALLKKNRPDLCVHKPYKEKKCEECHTPDKRLLMPMPDLCFKCHTNFQQTYAVVHGPVASGGCLNCHNQHSSRYPKLLTRQGQAVCMYCHAPAQVFAARVHRDIEDAECTMCHNPHGGKTRYMVKDHIPRDPNRIALLDDLTWRHLYGQIYCKVPGDISRIQEVSISDSRGTIVATAHPDANGRFYLSNLHPDQNYTFRFKKDFPDCRINILDNNGAVLYVIEKNKKSSYVFDKAAYESVHGVMSDAHFLGDTLSSGQVVSAPAEAVLRDTGAEKVYAGNKVADSFQTPPASIPPVLEGTPAVSVTKVTQPEPVAVPGQQAAAADSGSGKGKIQVKEIPGQYTSSEDLVKRPVDSEPAAKPAGHATDTATYKGKIVVRELPADAPIDKLKVDQPAAQPQGEVQEAPRVDVSGRKSKIVVTELPDTTTSIALNEFRPMPGAPAAVRKFEAQGVKLTDITLQAADYFYGTVVCILNEAGDLVDLAPVNEKGEFYLYDFLYYRISLPAPNSGIVSQAIFLNEKMELIESVNKRLENGRYVYVQNSAEPKSLRADVRIYADRSNAVLFTSVYFQEGQPAITAAGIKELNRVVDYLVANPKAGVYIAAHAGSNGTPAFNRQLLEKRAKATTDYLLARGIAPARIKEKGFGKKKNAAKFEITPGAAEELQKNRRADVFIKVN